ncbi:MAG: hypothetical protein R2836_07305 [Chitinophagales bacterium]
MDRTKWFTSNTATISIAVANEAQHEGVYGLTVTDNSTGCVQRQYMKPL